MLSEMQRLRRFVFRLDARLRKLPLTVVIVLRYLARQEVQQKPIAEDMKTVRLFQKTNKLFRNK